MALPAVAPLTEADKAVIKTIMSALKRAKEPEAVALVRRIVSEHKRLLTFAKAVYSQTDHWGRRQRAAKLLGCEDYPGEHS